jgi:hypothetical protein
VTPESLSPHFGSKILDEVEYISFSWRLFQHILDERQVDL